MITLHFDSRTLRDLGENEESYLLFSVQERGNGYEVWEERGVAGSETCLEEMMDSVDGDEHAAVQVTHAPYRFRMDPDESEPGKVAEHMDQMAMVRQLLGYTMRDVRKLEHLTAEERRIIETQERLDWLKHWIG